MLVDPKTRTTLATHSDPQNTFKKDGEFFTGALPSDMMLANTSVRWGEAEWAMVLLPLPQAPFSRIRLLAHESFHRIQPELDLKVTDSINSHLDSKAGRLWLRLELRTLARALRADRKAGLAAVRDALLFRGIRQSLGQSNARNEATLELQEGLAEYTGTLVALRSTGEIVGRVIREIEAFEDRPAFARSFAYATGPAFGLLLDRYAGPSWRNRLTRDSSLSEMLASAVRYRTRENQDVYARDRADLYGLRAVESAEEERDARHQRLIADFQTRFLKGPTLRFPKSSDIRRVFNPNNLVSLGDHGTVYPTGTFTSHWGKLQIDDVGGLLSPDNQSLRVVAPGDASARPVIGPGWTLDLAQGWIVRPVAGTSDFEVVPSQSVR